MDTSAKPFIDHLAIHSYEFDQEIYNKNDKSKTPHYLLKSKKHPILVISAPMPFVRFREDIGIKLQKNKMEIFLDIINYINQYTHITIFSGNETTIHTLATFTGTYDKKLFSDFLLLWFGDHSLLDTEYEGGIDSVLI